MQQSSKVKGLGFFERSLEQEISRDFLLQVIRQKINAYPLRDKVLFELSYYSLISSLEIITLNISDINVAMRTVRIKRGNEILHISMTDSCATLLNELCSLANLSDGPLFLNARGERMSLSNLWFIKKNFSVEVGPYP